ncbi:MAG: DUF4040 domain-containing protein [Desulfurivibrionaceae bacterium]
MIWQFDIIVLLFMAICAFFAIQVKDLLGAAIVLGVYSFLMCLLWTEMGAVDVAFTEAAVGAGVSTVLFIAAVHRSSRRVKTKRSGRMLSKAAGLASAGLLGAALFYASGGFPNWADPASPAASHLSPYFITQTLSDTSVPNIVTAVLADYRGYDTLFETAVIFTAGMAVLMILGRRHDENNIQAGNIIEAGYEDSIIQTVSRTLIPFIQIFALYVVGHGHHSPGGGFQGGVLLGATFVLMAISFNLKMVLGRISEKKNLLLANTGVIVYAGIGALCIALGANFLDYSILRKLLPATDQVMARSHAILGVEIGVAMTVTAIIILIYSNLASGGTNKKGL